MRAAVTLDFHNTLIHCDPWFDLEVRTLPSKVYARLASANGVAPAEIEATYGTLRREIMAHGNELDAVDGTQETFRRLEIPADRAEISAIVDDLFRELVDDSHPVQGAPELLAALSELGIPMGIVSSAVHHEFLRWCLERHGMDHYLTTIITSASAGYYKSNPEIYRIALRTIDADPRQSVHIGDSFRFDHLSSRQIGMATVWLNADQVPIPPSEPQPDLAVTSLFDLAPILDLVSPRVRAFDAN